MKEAEASHTRRGQAIVSSPKQILCVAPVAHVSVFPLCRRRIGVLLLVVRMHQERPQLPGGTRLPRNRSRLFCLSPSHASRTHACKQLILSVRVRLLLLPQSQPVVAKGKLQQTTDARSTGS